jgi:hypothetical protein
MLNCTQCAEVLPDILEGKGDPMLRRRILVQAERCDRCRRCVESYKKTADLTRIAYGANEPPDTCEHLLAFLRERVGSSQP